MPIKVWVLLVAQFFTALADNALLFAAIALAQQSTVHSTSFVPALQAVFLIPFVLAAPFAGVFADRHDKTRVLLLANGIKMLGVLLFLIQVSPLIAYAVVGLGAALYSPAKYGILPEWLRDQDLVKANGLIEAATIMAIISGSVTGATLADRSLIHAQWWVVCCYAISIAVAFALPRLAARQSGKGYSLTDFISQMGGFFATSRARFAMLGASLFWASAAVLRLLIVAWVPAVLALQGTVPVAELTLYLALGSVVGAAVLARWIPITHLRRARLAAYAMGVCILLFSTVADMTMARLTLFLVGLCGGLFLVPINAALQSLGHQGVGSGVAVAIQQGFENLAMLIAVGIYLWASVGVFDPVRALIVLGLSVVVATLIIAWRLPKAAQSG